MNHNGQITRLFNFNDNKIERTLWKNIRFKGGQVSLEYKRTGQDLQADPERDS